MTFFYHVILAAFMNVAFAAIAGKALFDASASTKVPMALNAAFLGLCSVLQATLSFRVADTGTTIVFAVLTASIAVSVLTDLQTGYILDVVTVPGMVFAFAFSILSGASNAVFLGAACTWLPVAVLHVVSKGRGIGLGDAKLAACMGALLGPQRGLISLGAAFVFGGCIAAVLILGAGAEKNSSVPFAPYLAAGTLAVLIASVV